MSEYEEYVFKILGESEILKDEMKSRSFINGFLPKILEEEKYQEVFVGLKDRIKVEEISKTDKTGLFKKIIEFATATQILSSEKIEILLITLNLTQKGLSTEEILQVT